MSLNTMQASNTMTKLELIDMIRSDKALKLACRGYSSMKKAELITAINKHSITGVVTTPAITPIVTIDHKEEWDKLELAYINTNDESILDKLVGLHKDIQLLGDKKLINRYIVFESHNRTLRSDINRAIFASLNISV